MNVSDKAIEMLCHHEGVRRKPYQDCIGLWTVGVASDWGWEVVAIGMEQNAHTGGSSCAS
jgi:GH24 family phage-related lysozyme (muramidase)